jgi:hypothetical protein
MMMAVWTRKQQYAHAAQALAHLFPSLHHCGAEQMI